MSQAVPERLKTSPALQYVTKKGWDWQEAGNEQIQLASCPFCKGDKFMMSVMAPEIGTRDGLYMCFKARCSKTGNLRTLQEAMGDKIPNVESRNDWAGKNDKKIEALPDVSACHAALLSDAESMDYLLNVRGFTREVIERQKLGLKEKVYFREAGETRALVIPYLSIEGNTTFTKYRSLPPAEKAFACPQGWDVGLYNASVLNDACKEIIMVEGECDAISLMSHGVDNVVGVPGAAVKKAEWIAALDRVDPKIYILYDSDRAGQKGAQELASRIGIERCMKVALPGSVKDINQWFVEGGTTEQFEKLKMDARQFDVNGVTSSGDALQQLEDELAGKVDLAPTYVTQWPSLNKLVGFEAGDVIDILAPEKVGKSTFALNMVDHLGATYGEDVLFVCLEMTAARLARKWVAMLTGFEDRITTPGTEESRTQLEGLKAACVTAREIQQTRNADMYFAYPQLYKTPEDIYKLIKDCVRRYGVSIVVVDNLQLLCDNTLENKGHRTIHLSQISKGLAKLAKDHKIKLVRILQPRQIEDGQIVQSRHVDGSSQIVKDTDALISLWRSQTGTTKKSEWEKGQGEEGEASFGPKMKVTVALSRYSSGGSCSLFFDGARSQVKEYDSSQKHAMNAAKAEYNSLIPMEQGGNNGSNI